VTRFWAVSRLTRWKAPTLPACHLARSGRNPDVRLLAGGLPNSENCHRPRTAPLRFLGPSQDRRLTLVSVADRLLPTGPPGSQPSAMTDPAAFSHEPVMLAEILDVFEPVVDGVIVDATLGGAGHASAILDAHASVRLVGLDQDRDALAAAARRLEPHEARVDLCHTRFDGIAQALDDLGIGEITGILFDLGVSSHQLDVGERGFSFRNDGPLDMRMDQSRGQTAAELVNEADGGDLAFILRTYGDERHARRLAAAIVAQRPHTTTARLAEVVMEAMPAASRRSPGHPARRTFQALRIAVNLELDVLAPALEAAIERLAPGGRGAVLSYHSGEDRIVKRTLRAAAGLGANATPAALVTEGPVGDIALLHRPGRTPSDAELEQNPRSSPARLRSFERLARSS
jgi:16S rRNA (cytosine1402-N4)-methyltransferase